MRRLPSLFVCWFLGACACAAAQAETLQCTPINAVPFTIATPGSYCLIGDLASTASGTSAAITIASDDVQLDLNGHSLVGPGGAGAGYGVYAIAHHGLRVRNGALRGFSYGVFITDTMVGLPAVAPSGGSTRHEISELRVEGASVGISVLGHFSSVHDNAVLDSSQMGIWVGTGFVPGNTGPVDVRANRVINTIVAHGATAAVYGITNGGTGSLIQDNFVGTVRGPNGSAAIRAGGVGVIVSRNRESDLGTSLAVVCLLGTNTNATIAKVEGNLTTGFGANTGISGCMLVGTNG